jgi:hypothetical protein
MLIVLIVCTAALGGVALGVSLFVLAAQGPREFWGGKPPPGEASTTNRW